MKIAFALAGALLATVTMPVSAQSLNFAGLNGDAQELVLEYYNGGTGSLGSGPGTNYGISFSNNAIACSVQPGGNCNSAALPTGGNLLFFLTGAASTMNVAGGFNTGFSFYYSAVNNPAFVNVYSGLNATGSILATINLPTTQNGAGVPGCFGANFCPYVPIGVTFAGTAMSVDFGGSANQVAFADITINSATPGNPGVPEPATWAMMIGGFALAGAAMRGRKAVASFA
ncbi:PEPxxWA-CTERM sorting domain-containing protein [Sphingobium nicotianae]|uniref:PEPxxWA-CTERM sorting domain-containing protein n=1 Tax=Sphingobium nicotianae TaxID=2782607 RepID=A0A9X1DD11_9SPHN|nr:PEPxxWA-CTERM sorting domain-containing protein [Sphingobium nicotianae]MBT2187293.1 PEPxxWA-CTERM sorting domain-containing protein [Sphingobium nicotianae]